MGARVNDSIHIQVQVVKFFVVRVRASGIYWHDNPVDLLRLFLDDWGYNLRVLDAQ
jgi:hypothetical protein